MLELDHVIVTVADPQAWARQLTASTGLKALPGGRHEGLGTGNWIVPLGPDYLELMTITDPIEAQGSSLGRWVRERTRTGDGLSAVCLRTDHIDAVAGQIGTVPAPMSRRTEDGTVLRWRLAGLDAAMSTERLPFFIQWDIDDNQHPGRSLADHQVEPRGIARVEFGGDPQRLAEWLGDGHGLPLQSVEGPPGPRRIAVSTSHGTVELTATGLP